MKQLTKSAAFCFFSNFLLLCILFSPDASNAQCTPNAPTGTPGMTPPSDSLPCIERGVFYDETVFIENLDTVNSGFGDIIINYLTIDSITNLPGGIGWQPNPDSTFLTGETGCIDFTGTTTDSAGDYQLGIWITINYTNAILGTQTMQGEASALIAQIEAITGPMNIDFSVFFTVIDSGALCRPPCVDETDTADVSICAGDSVLAGGAYQTTNGTYVDSFVSSLGCDSVIVTELTVINPVTSNVDTAVCAGDSVLAGGIYQTTSGTYYDTLTAASGCDSIVVTNLNVINPVTSSIDTTVCAGDSILAGGIYQTTSGTYYDTLTAASGCDSIVVTNLTVINPVSSSIDTAVCAGDSVLAGGIYQTTSGTYYDTLTAASGCDSIVVTNLTVINPVSSSIDTAVCAGDSVLAGGIYQTTSGTYYDTLTAASGCDSIVVTNLTVHPDYLTNLFFTICTGDSVFAGGNYQTSDGTYYDTLTSAFGCDSVIQTEVNVVTEILASVSQSICDGDSFFAGGAFQTISGLYYDTLVASGGCDSIIETDLIVLSVALTNRPLSICDNDSVLAGGAYQNTTGIYYDTLTAANGCDSIVVTDLTVLSTALTNLSFSVCAGDSVFAGGAYQTASGTYYDTLTAANTCDSIVVTDLTVAAAIITNVSTNICDGDSAFAGGGEQTTSGTYYDTLAAANGCDSVVVTVLTVLPIAQTTLDVSICAGDSVFAGGAYQTASGTYYDTLTAANTCDSIVTTNLAVLTSIFIQTNETICAGDSFLAGGAFQTTSGLYYDTLVASGGCDSIVETDLFVAPVSTMNISYTICDGDSVFAGGAEQTTSGIYYDTLVSSFGCDSIIVSDVTVLSITTTNVAITICDGDSVFAGGAEQTTSGIYYDTLVSSFGCDSIIQTEINVVTEILTSVSQSICDGDSFFAGGAFQTISGLYYDTLIASGGCDSIIETDLAVLSVALTNRPLSICDNDSVFAGGAYQNTTGVYYDTLSGTNGCDSIVVTNLTVLSTVYSSLSFSVCAGDSVFAGGAYQTASGTYYDTLTAANTCDSIVTTNLAVVTSIFIQTNETICAGDSFLAGGAFQTTSGLYYDTLVASGGCDSIVETDLFVAPVSTVNVSYTICDGDSVFAGGAEQTTSGIYYDTLVSSFGCDSIVVTDLTVLPNTQASVSASICSGDSVFAGGAYQTTPGTYYDTLVAANTCDSVVTTTVTFALNGCTDPSAANYDPNAVCDDGSCVYGCTPPLPTGTPGLTPDTLPCIIRGTTYNEAVYLENFTTFNSSFGVITVNFLTIDSITNLPAGITWQANPGATFLGGETGCIQFSGLSNDVPADYQLGLWITIQVSSPAIGTQTFSGEASALIAQLEAITGPLGVEFSVVLTVINQGAPCHAGCQATNNTIDISICAGDSIFVGGDYQTTDGVYTDSFINAGGCDSIIITNLSVVNSFFLNQSLTMCDGDSVFLGGAFQTTSGIYYDSLVSSSGCDSILATTLAVLSVFRDSFHVAICATDSFFAGGAYQNTSGTYIDSFISASGCDSILVTILDVISEFVTNNAVALCNGSSYFAGGALQTTAGIYYDTLLSVPGCDSIIVTDLQFVAFFFIQDTVDICDGESYFAGGALQTTSGIYYDSLVASGGCDSIVETHLTVNPLPVAGFTPLDSAYCTADAPVALTGSPAGGTFSGPGVTGNVFDPAAATAGGPYTISYVYSNGCSDTATQQVTVLQSPPANFSGLEAAYCYDAPADSLFGNPNGYFTGPGISGNTFVPYFAGPGTHQITQVVPSTAGCNAASTLTTIVYDSIVPSISNLDSAYCSTDADITLTGSPAGGVFTGTGMSGDIFSPESAGAGTHTIEYTYTDTSNGCSGTTFIDVEVKPVPEATIDGLPDNTCLGSGTTFTLTGAPAGGTFSGAGVSGSSFTPDSAGLGVHVVTYSGPAGNGCSFLQKEFVSVNEAPTPSITGLNATYCFNDSAVILTGSPAGGTFSGPGVAAGYFIPEAAGSGGPFAIQYEYTDTNGCTGTASQDVTVNALTPVSISNLGSYYAVSDAAVIVDGIPAGGEFIGPGMSGNTFTPADAGIGQHTIVYLYEDSNGCVNAALQDVSVGFTGVGLAEISSFRMYPNPFTGSFSIEMELPESADVQIFVFDALGNMHMNIPKHIAQGKQQLLIENDLAPGLYVVNIKSEKFSIAAQMIKMD